MQLFATANQNRYASAASLVFPGTDKTQRLAPRQKRLPARPRRSSYSHAAVAQVADRKGYVAVPKGVVQDSVVLRAVTVTRRQLEAHSEREDVRVPQHGIRQERVVDAQAVP